MPGRTYSAGNLYRYGFNGKENDRNISADDYDFGARIYDGRIGRWLSVDPLALKFLWQSPYCAMDNIPILKIDPTGMAASPVYDKDGSFLGTDNQGISGDAIVMDKKDFKQGMEHGDAVKLNKGVTALAAPEAKAKFANHYYELSSRPDYDGFVTMFEGIAWAKAHPNLDNDNNETNGMGNATPNDWLYIDASKLNFGTLKVDELKVNEITSVNLLFKTDLSSESSFCTTYALGSTKIRLLNTKGVVEVINGTHNIYNWDINGSSLRRFLIKSERARAGLNDTHGFPLYIYGTGMLNPPPSLEITPQNYYH